MSSKVLKSFLIGIGYDTKGLDEGDKKIGNSLNGVKTGALGVSAALVGAFGLVAASVNSTATQVDQLALNTQNLRTSTNAVYNYGSAIKLMGGEASEALDALTRFEDIQNNLRLKGDAGPIQDLATAGIDTQPLYATGTGEEFLRELARQIPGLDEGQRSQVQGSLGLSDAAFRSIAGGVDQLDAAMAKARTMTGDIDELVENSRKLRESSATMGLAVDGVRNELAVQFLPALAGASSAVSDFAVETRKFLKGETPEGQAFKQSGTAGILAVGAEKAGADQGGAALRAAGLILDQTPKSSILEAGIPGVKQARGLYDYLFGEGIGTTDGNRVDHGAAQEPYRSDEYQPNGFRQDAPHDVTGGRTADDAMTPPPSYSREDERAADAASLAGALSRTPIKVESRLNATLSLDGQALETKIIQVNERQNYETMSDLKTTTER